MNDLVYQWGGGGGGGSCSSAKVGCDGHVRLPGSWRGSWSKRISILDMIIAPEPWGWSSWSPHLSCNLDPVHRIPWELFFQCSSSGVIYPVTLWLVLCPLNLPPGLTGLGRN